MFGNSSGSTARVRSRLRAGKLLTSPLCIHSQRPCRNGWQLVSCTGEPLDARMWAKMARELMCAARLRRFRSFHAGSTL
jgi:hypothetical protein